MLIFTGVRGPVKIGYLESELVKVLRYASIWSQRHGTDVAVTSCNDHDHSDGSLHYKDLACDLQLIPKTQSHIPLENFLRGELGLGYDVVLETSRRGTDHLHIEWDVRRR